MNKRLEADYSLEYRFRSSSSAPYLQWHYGRLRLIDCVICKMFLRKLVVQTFYFLNALYCVFSLCKTNFGFVNMQMSWSTLISKLVSRLIPGSSLAKGDIMVELKNFTQRKKREGERGGGRDIWKIRDKNQMIDLNNLTYWEIYILGWVKSFAIFCYVWACVTAAVEDVVGARSGWYNCGSWCADTLSIASLSVWFEIRTDEHTT